MKQENFFFSYMFDFAIQNSADVLNVALAVCVVMVSLLLCLVLIRLFRVLGTLDDTLLDIQETVELVQNYLWQPARIFLGIKEKLSTIFSIFFGKKK